MRRMHRAGCLLLSLAVSACSASETTMNTDNPASPAPDAEQAALESRYKRNPNPQQAYRLTMTIADAPGSFESMQGLLQYDVVNPECLPPPNSNPGGHSSHLTQHVPFALSSVSETEYEAMVYADMMVDEDYHGRGVCRWQLIQARVHMKATGADGETLFIPSISAKVLSARQSERLFFLKQFYPRTESGNLPDIGITAADRNPTLPESAWFYIALSAKKEMP